MKFNPDLMYVDENGYPRFKYKGKMAVHIWVIQRKLGRKLRPEEVVHHIDGDKMNFGENNLLLFPNQVAHEAHHREMQEKTGSWHGIVKTPKPESISIPKITHPPHETEKVIRKSKVKKIIKKAKVSTIRYSPVGIFVPPRGKDYTGLYGVSKPVKQSGINIELNAQKFKFKHIFYILYISVVVFTIYLLYIISEPIIKTILYRFTNGVINVVDIGSALICWGPFALIILCVMIFTLWLLHRTSIVFEKYMMRHNKKKIEDKKHIRP